jgi:hypothetical protein
MGGRAHKHRQGAVKPQASVIAYQRKTQAGSMEMDKIANPLLCMNLLVSRELFNMPHSWWSAIDQKLYIRTYEEYTFS